MEILKIVKGIENSEGLGEQAELGKTMCWLPLSSIIRRRLSNLKKKQDRKSALWDGPLQAGSPARIYTWRGWSELTETQSAGCRLGFRKIHYQQPGCSGKSVGYNVSCLRHCTRNKT
jgi:hypothetical protein